MAIVGAVALSGSALLTPPTLPAFSAGPTTIRTEATLLDTEAWGIGGSGNPIPSAQLIDAVNYRYSPAAPWFGGQPLFPVDVKYPLATPEQWYPVLGVKQLTLDESIAQGVQILHNTITDRIAAGHNLVIAGGSQSASIESLEMRNLLALPADQQPTAGQLAFVLLGDPNNPNGGLFERFGDPSLPPLTAPSLGITFSGATPADTPWHTAIYSLEYDGFADFPRYPLNTVSVLNALAGIIFVHPTYDSLPVARLAGTVELPVSDDYTGHTQYFMIPTENLPLLEPLRFLPVVGDPLADLLQPALRVLVNLGYGSLEHGWDPGPANLPTPFELFPNVDLGEVFTALADGARQGFRDFTDDLDALSPQQILAEVAAGAAGGGSLPSLTDAVNAFTGALATGQAALLPTADVVNFLTTTLPAYDLSLFLHGLGTGSLLDAVALPIAANSALVPLAIGFELAVVLNTVESLVAELQGLFA